MENVFGKSLEGKLENQEVKDKRNQRGVNRRRFLNRIMLPTLAGAGILGIFGLVGGVAVVSPRLPVRKIDKERYEKVSVGEILTKPDYYKGRLVEIDDVELKYPLCSWQYTYSRNNDIISSLLISEPNNLELNIIDKNSDEHSIHCYFTSEKSADDYEKVSRRLYNSNYKGHLAIRGLIKKGDEQTVAIIGHSIDLEETPGNIKTFYLSDKISVGR